MLLELLLFVNSLFNIILYIFINLCILLYNISSCIIVILYILLYIFTYHYMFEYINMHCYIYIYIYLLYIHKRIYIFLINLFYFTLFYLMYLFYHSASIIFGWIIISIGSIPDKILPRKRRGGGIIFPPLGSCDISPKREPLNSFQ